MKKFFHHLSRGTIRLLEILLGLAIVLMVGGGFLLWQMSRGPVDLMFAESYIERALSTENYDVTFADVDLTWPKMRGRLRLNIQGLELKNHADGQTALSIPEVDVGLHTRFLVIGMIRPASVFLKSPSFQVVKQKDGKLVFLYNNTPVDQLEEPAKVGPAPRRAGLEQVKYIVREFAVPRRGSLFAGFRSLVIEDASLSLYDAASKKTLLNFQSNLELTRSREATSADVTLTFSEDESIGGISAHMDYAADTEIMDVTVRMKDIGSAVIAPFFDKDSLIARQSGSMNLQLDATYDKDMDVQSLSSALQIPEATIDYPEEFDAPVAIKDFSASASYDPESKTLSSTDLTLSVQDNPIKGGVQVVLGEEVIDITANLTTTGVPQETVETLFPKSELDGDLAEWIVHRMEGGTFNNVEASLPLTLRRESDEEGNQFWDVIFDESQINVTFAADGVNLTYEDTLMPAKNIVGQGSFNGETLDITAESGEIGAIKASNASVVVSDVLGDAGRVDVKLDIDGPLAEVLRYVDDEPINKAKDIGFDPDEVKGTFKGTVEVGMPVVGEILEEDVSVKISGTLNELFLPDVVQGLPVSGGPVALETAGSAFMLKGDAKLDGYDVTFDMTQHMDSTGKDFLTKVSAKTISDAKLRNHFGVDLSEYISGPVPLDIVYTDKGNGTEIIDIKADLAPTIVHIRPFKYSKLAESEGSVTAQATLKNNHLTTVKNLTISAPDLSIDGASLTFRQTKSGDELAGGKLPTAKVGQSVANVDFEITPENLLKIVAEGPVLDATPFMESANEPKGEEAAPGVVAGQSEPAGAKSQPMDIRLNADKIITTGDMVMENAKAYLVMDEEGDFTRIELDARAGEGDVYVRFRPDPQTGKRFFRLEALDAGSFLRASGLYENVRGGTIHVYGEPKDGESVTGDLYGTAQLENFRVVKAPALARLLGLMSLTGVGQLLGNEGLAFSKLEADFEWLFRENGNYLMVKEGRTSGSSIGLTFEGMIDRAAETTDIQGTIIPMTEVNSLLSNIPLMGEILTGGSGLIAATYTMKGPSSDPNVSVNPLSVLAPGFLRKLLFEGGYTKPIPPKEGSAAANDNKKSAVTPPATPSRTATQR